MAKEKDTIMAEQIFEDLSFAKDVVYSSTGK